MKIEDGSDKFMKVKGEKVTFWIVRMVHRKQIRYAPKPDELMITNDESFSAWPTLRPPR